MLEWMQWRKSILDELTLFGSIGRRISTLHGDSDAEYEWSFYIWFKNANKVKYTAGLCQSHPLQHPRGCPIP